MNRVLMQLTQLEDRCQPAEIKWLGGDTNLWRDHVNWEGGTRPGENDDAILTGSPTHAPRIEAGEDFTVKRVVLGQTATFSLQIDGTLNTKATLIQPWSVQGFWGIGTLTLTDTVGAEPDHVWHSGFVKVKTVEVEGGVLQVRSTFGQVGPDEVFLGGSNWKVGTSGSAGTVQLNGDHFVGFDSLTIVKGEVKYVTSGTLTDLPLAGSGNPWKAFTIENVDKFEIAEGQAVALTGGRYLQTSGTSTFQPGSSLSIAGFAGASNPPAYSFDMLSGKLIAFESAGITTRTDIRISDAIVDFYCPGVFTRNNGPEQTSQLGIVARDGTTNKDIQITNTPIKFLDWNPAGRYTSATQVGGKFNIGGHLKLDGTTELVLRVDLTTIPRMDRAFDATGPATLSGNALKLTLNLKNIPQQGNMFMFNDLLWCTALTAPNPPFATVSVSSPGWNATLTKDANSLDLVLRKM
jgi:hypothetical protein